MELPKELLDKLSNKLAAEAEKSLREAEDKLNKKHEEFVNDIKEKSERLVKEFASKISS